ncbi:MAG: ComEC/Rec2 family competence protein [Planctomycetota bacterium]
MPEPSPRTAEPCVDAPRYQPLVVVLAAVCSGIVADRFWPTSVLLWWSAAGGALIVWLGLWRRGWERTASIVLVLAVAATGASWHHCRWFLFDRHDLGCYARADGQPVCLEAIALESPRIVPAPDPDPMEVIPRGDRARLELALCSVRDGVRWRAVSGRTRLEVDGHLLGVAAGDRLRIFGQLYLPRGTQNPGEFDYAAYLRARRLRSLVRTQYPECVSLIEPGRGWRLRRLIDRTRSHGNRLLRQHLHGRRSALAAAVLLGARERVDIAQKEAFMQTGTVHLLAISGLHVGILAGALLLVMLRAPIPRGWAMLSVAAFAVFYMLLTDARPPVIRATILVLMICWSLYLGRRTLSFNSLAAAAMVVLAVNPADLFHTGAQLSFLAVAGLMWFAPKWIYSTPQQDPLQRMIGASRAWPARMLWVAGRSLRHLTLVSATIWLLTMPLVMARFNLFSPIAVVLNTLLWVPMALALLSGFATLVFGTLAGPVGQVFGTVCDANLRLLDSSVVFARDLPWSHCWVPGPADWWLAVFYGSLGLLAAFPRIRPPRRWFVALLAGWVAVGAVPAWLRPQPDRLDCTFLSVGHGCAVVVELPSGSTVLYDAGQLGSGTSAARSIAGLLWSRGITHLDAVVLSHADIDHYNALPGLLDRFSVGVVYVSPVMWEDRGPALTALREAIRESGVPLRELRAGDRLPGGEECLIEVLHPPRRDVLGGDNPNSIVLDVQYLGHRVLLPGDLEPPGLYDLLAEEPIDCDVLLVPHHGSRQSNPPGLAVWSTPEWVVVSGGRRWDPEEIEAAYRAAGCRVLHTADTGAVGVSIDAAGVRVDGFLSPGE